MPFRDFWEHHTPLAWFLFAPFTTARRTARASTRSSPCAGRRSRCGSPRSGSLNVWMRGVGHRALRALGGDGARALQLAVHDAGGRVPRRVRSAALLFMAGLVLAQRQALISPRASLSASPASRICASGRCSSWRCCSAASCATARATDRRRRIVAGARRVPRAIFAATGSLDELWQQVWRRQPRREIRRRRCIGALHPPAARAVRRAHPGHAIALSSSAAVDVGGIAVLLLGFAGHARCALAQARRVCVLVLILQLANLALHRLDEVHLQLPLRAGGDPDDAAGRARSSSASRGAAS